MRKTIGIFIFWLSTISVAHAQVEMDAIAFARDSGKTQVEIYYSIAQGALPAEQKNGGWTIPIKARAELWQDNKVIASHDIRKEKFFKGTKAEFDSAQHSLIIDGAAFTITMKPIGEAVLIFYGKDAKSKETADTIHRNFTAPSLSSEHFVLGGIELAGSLTPTTDRSNPFEKFGYIILPNPSTVFGVGNTKLSYYSELYVPPAVSGDCEVLSRVLDASGHVMVSASHHQALGNTMVPLIGTLDIDGLPGDSYMLEITVTRSGKTEAANEKTFFFDDGMKLSEEKEETSSPIADEETIFLSSDISKMAELEIRDRTDQAMYLAVTEQQKTWKNLKKKLDNDAEHSPEKEKDIEAARRFLFGFWRGKDKERGKGSPLEISRAFYRNVEDVNRKFTYQKTPGWATDRGRIYLTYGAPDERNILTELHSYAAKPYIIWNYYNKNIATQSVSLGLPSAGSPSNPFFVFLDRQLTGRFELVHSNVTGEISEPNWYSQDAYRVH